MKKFYRSKSNRILSGICGGLGEYFDTDPLLWESQKLTQAEI